MMDKDKISQKYDQEMEQDHKTGHKHSHDESAIHEACDYEIHAKKDCPPRFSTIFDTKPQPRLDPVQELPPSRRRNGVHMPTSVFILIMTILVLETLLIFAYTAIGLMNNMPGRSTAFTAPLTAGCDLPGTQHAAPVNAAPVNISPNFMIGGAGERVTVTETVSASPSSTTASSASTLSSSQSSAASSSTSSGSSSSAVPSTLAKSSATSSAAVSSSSTSNENPVVTVTPGGGTATEIVLVTASPSSNVHAGEPLTSFMTVFVAPSVLLAQQSSASSASEAAKAQEHLQVSTATASPATSISSRSTTDMTTSTTSPTKTSATTTQATGKVCVGGAGAVALDCF